MAENLIAVDYGASSLSQSRESSARSLASLRAELATSYPTVNYRAVNRTLRASGRSSFPAGFLLPAGREQQSLRAASRPGGGPDEGLFSAEFYRLTNPDVAASGVSPWLHYQVFGRAEGRSPHPLIDVRTLAASAGGTALGSLVDEYLELPSRWLSEPGPYVECGRFALSGAWTEAESPLAQLVRENRLAEPWVHARLMLVDAGDSAETAEDAVIGGAYLLSSGPGHRLSTIVRWQERDDSDTQWTGALTVIPGWFAGSQGTQIYQRPGMTTVPDRTAIRLATETLTVESGSSMTADRLVFVTGHQSHGHLSQLVDDAPARTIVCPYSPAQETALRQLRRDRGAAHRITVLSYGNQCRVTAGTVEFMRPAPPPIYAPWSYENMPADGTAVVIPISDRRRSTGDRRLRQLLASGASLCLVDESGLNTWLPIIQSRALVAADSSLADDVAAFVDEAALRLLPPRDGLFS